MSHIIQPHTVTEAWQQIVKAAGDQCHYSLDEEMESYLVFMLMRHTRCTDMADSIVASRYCQGLQSSGQQAIEQLRDVGDQCLLFCGLFPERSRRRLVKSRYYMDIGRSAYSGLANRLKLGKAQMYQKLAHYFGVLMDLLLAMRMMDGSNSIDTRLLLELSRDCESEYARKVLKAENLLVLPVV